MFGASRPEDLLGQQVLSRFHPDSHPLVRERLRRLEQESSALPTTEHKCIRPDGTTFEAEFSSVPSEYEGQTGALVFFQEVTERKRLEAQLRQAQKLEAIGQLAGGVAHDFNNILAAMMMRMGLLQMSPGLDQETRDTLQELDAGAQRAASLTRQLLMFSRRSVLMMKPLDLNDLITNMLRMLTRLVREDIELQFQPGGGLPIIQADAGMLEQVLMNLVVNARDALPNGGRILISTERTLLNSSRTVQDREIPGGTFVCLSVTDNGCGMDKTTLKRIFEPFYTTKEPGKGTGLGLATVHGIVAQHKGWVEVQSELGRGAKFNVILPASGQNEAPKPAESKTTAVLQGNETILLAEDDDRVRATISQALTVLGYKVHAARNGQEAMGLWQAHQHGIDLLLTDMVMPEGMTGLELADQLRAFKPNLKVIISSGYTAETVQIAALTKERVVYLQKPYEPQTLAKVLRECFDC